MLVLSRQRSESLVISGGITVRIIEVRGDKVRIGIEAPRDVSIHREEIHELIQQGTTENPYPAKAA